MTATGSDTTSPLHSRSFMIIWIATLSANVGIVIQSVGASWLMVETGGSPQMIAFVQTAASLPLVMLSPIGGAFADSRNRRQIMIGSQIALVAMSCALAICTGLGLVAPDLVLIGTFLIGCTLALHGPAWMASLGDILPRAALPRAVVFNAVGLNLARSVGPAMGGFIVATLGATAAFSLNGATALALVIVLLLWKPSYSVPSLPPERVLDALTAGLRYVVLSPSIFRVLARTLVLGCSASFVQALLPLIARDLLAGGAGTFGILFASFGVGAFVGAAMGQRLRDLLPPEPLVRTCTLAIAVSCASAAFSKWVLLTCLLLSICGAAWVAAFSTFNVSIQLSSPRWVVGRSLSLYQTAVYIGVAVGSIMSGVIAERYGTTNALLASSVLTAIGLIASSRLRLNPITVDDPQIELVNRSQCLTNSVPVTDRSGPISISIHHRVLEERIPEFVLLMQERRRIRTRDGARQWTLLQDMEDDELWIERYDFPTWMDYVRHQQRRTLSYEENRGKLANVWLGGKEASVRRRIHRDTSEQVLGQVSDGTHHPVQPM